MDASLYQPFPMAVPLSRAQVWRHEPQFRRPRHFHDEPELNLVVSGRARFGVGDVHVIAEAGDLLWFTPGQDHVLLEASADLDLFVFGVTPDFSSRVLGSEPARRALSGPLRARLARPDVTRLQELSAAVAARPAARTMEERVGDLWREANALRALPPSLHALSRRALHAILADPECARDDLAAQIRGCPSEVSRHFHRDLGLTLAQYRTRVRLLRFIHAVEAGATLTVAAFDAGFGSYSQCHRAFQGTLGCGPREFFRHDLRVRMAETFASDPAGALVEGDKGFTADNT